MLCIVDWLSERYKSGHDNAAFSHSNPEFAVNIRNAATDYFLLARNIMPVQSHIELLVNTLQMEITVPI